MSARQEQRPDRRRIAWPLIMVVAVLGACGEPQDELQQWMDAEHQQARPRVQPLVPPRRFDPQPYRGTQGPDPFSQQKLAVAVKQEDRQPSSLLASQMNRRREPLEAFPLDAISMVGSVSRGGVPFGLVKADNLLHQVKVGDYMGQNFGRIVKVTETEITLREIVQDAVGEWIERDASLQLQERAQEKVR